MRVAGDASATVTATPDKVLATLTDFAAYPQWWPGCLRADVVGGSAPSSYEVAFTFDTHSPVGNVDVTLRFDRGR